MEKTLSATSIKIRKSVFSITLNCPGEPSEWEVRLRYRRFGSDISYPFQVAGPPGKLTASIDIAELPLQDGDWAVVAEPVQTHHAGKTPETANPPSQTAAISSTAQDPTSEHPVVITGKVHAALILGNYEIRKGAHILFPVGSVGWQLILRCRLRKSYDSLSTRLKETAAYAAYRLLRPFIKQKRRWLVYEKYCIAAQDNGFYFFQYCMENLSPAENRHIYYILDRDSAQWEKAAKYGKHVIPFMSFRHMFSLLTANLYVASDSRLHAYAWLPKPNLISREIGHHDIFFLQHGVTAMKRVDNLFGKKGSAPMTYFTTVSQFEQDIVTQNFGYTRETAPILGFTRWDVLKDRSPKTDRNLLVMPTWRSWLEDQSDEVFCSSEYYQTYMNLLQNRELLDFLREKRVKLVFYIHPKLREFLRNFRAESETVELIPFGGRALNELIMECSALVTDYSSVAWDVYYIKKPVIFYQFDAELYERSTGSYIDMNTELFGPRCLTETELVRTIEDCVQNDFQEQPHFAEMREKYFAFHDQNNCKRTYDFILKQGY